MINLKDFEFQRILGVGAFGQVFLAKLRTSDRYFAIKRMSKLFLKKNRQLDNITNEQKILSKCLNCPFIIRLFSQIETKTHIFLVMEYAKGGELFYYLKQFGQFDLNTIQFMAAEILVALDFLHRKNLLYRDLKPENVLLTDAGHVKLADFGFATAVGENTFTICGTVEYMAPEKLTGQGDGKETDYWALGCMIYEMAVGYPPFYEDSQERIYESILTKEPDFEVFPDYHLRDLLLKLLSKDRTKRLGYNGIREIYNHNFFRSINWDLIKNRKVLPPIIPVSYVFDTETCHTEDNVPISAKHTYKRIFQ